MLYLVWKSTGASLLECFNGHSGLGLSQSEILISISNILKTITKPEHNKYQIYWWNGKTWKSFSFNSKKPKAWKEFLWAAIQYIFPILPRIAIPGLLRYAGFYRSNNNKSGEFDAELTSGVSNENKLKTVWIEPTASWLWGNRANHSDYPLNLSLTQEPIYFGASNWTKISVAPSPSLSNSLTQCLI